MNIFPLLIAALAWIAVSTPAAAEPSPNVAANPAAATTRAEDKIIENVLADAPSTCEYGCEEYREGAEICINKKLYQCSNRSWQPNGLSCANPPIAK